MKSITAQEFLSKSKKIQKVLKEWYFYNIEVLDSVLNPIGGGSYDILILIHIDINKPFYRSVLTGKTYEMTTFDDILIPLFDEMKLRKFIEDQTGKKIELCYDSKDGYAIFFTNGEIDCNNPDEYISYLGVGIHDLLEAYWQVVCKIADEIEVK